MEISNSVSSNDAGNQEPNLNSSFGEGGIWEMQKALMFLNAVEHGLACCQEKLLNLHILLMPLLGWEFDPDEAAFQNSSMPTLFIEKALLFDILSGILVSELEEVENFLNALQAEIFDFSLQISSYRHLSDRLLFLERSLKQSQQLVLELKVQSDGFEMLFSKLRHDNSEHGKNPDKSERSRLLVLNGKSKVWTFERQRHIARMLEKSLAREQDLVKRITELLQNEEQLKLKLSHTEQIALRMEEGAEVVWGRFLEAENASEVLMGISREMCGQLQVTQFNQSCLVLQEADLKSKLLFCLEELKTEDSALGKLQISNAELILQVSEVSTLKEKVKDLEYELKTYEIELKTANASYEASQEQLHEMQSVIEALKESTYEAQMRAESAEAKVSELTDANMELTEELNFLKSNSENNTKKTTSLEKQVRDLEIQMLHAKASSEASQEQQNMLYSAIWDMETLIEDLKSKVSRAESKTDIAEDNCVKLSETNSELNDEVRILRDRIECLEKSLNHANAAKHETVKEVNRKTSLIMDMVMQLATERERIQKQLLSVTKENELLKKNLENIERKKYTTLNGNIGDYEDKEIFQSKSTCTFDEVVSSTASIQEDKSSEHSFHCEAEPNNDEMDAVPAADPTNKPDSKHISLSHIFLALLVAVFSVLGVHLLKEDKSSEGYSFHCETVPNNDEMDAVAAADSTKKPDVKGTSLFHIFLAILVAVFSVLGVHWL